MRLLIAALSMLGLAAPASADDRAFCADRPGLGSPPCTLVTGQVMIELGLAGWDHGNDSAQVSDSWSGGDILVRLGIDAKTELQLGQSGYSSSRTRDKASGLVARVGGIGDTTVAIQRGLAGANGPVALQAFLTLPTGNSGIGTGTWSAGAKVPIAVTLPRGFELDLTPELDAAANASGAGRHFAWGGVLGLGHPLGRALSAEAELAAWQDLDPAGHSTDARAAVSLAWMARADWQLDAEADLGLASGAPDRALRLGLAHRF